MTGQCLVLAFINKHNTDTPCNHQQPSVKKNNHLDKEQALQINAVPVFYLERKTTKL